jgi:hypothetical protein
VSRGLAAVIAVALVASLVPELGALGGDARAAAADCTWQRHSKRVVKHVKRDGHPRRLVRTKRWWTCVPVPVAATPAVTSIPAPAADPAPAPAAQPAPSIGRLSVRAEEWSLTLSNSSPVTPGEVIVELNNEGTDTHDLKLQREGEEDPPLEVSEAGPGERRTARFNLAAGTYQLWCSLPEHRERGMSVTLQVAGG